MYWTPMYIMANTNHIDATVSKVRNFPVPKLYDGIMGWSFSLNDAYSM